MISEKQKASFLEDGYMRIENAVPPRLLKHWQNLADRLEREALEVHGKGGQLPGVCVVEDPVGPRVMRFDDILAIDPDACLELLACPAMMAVAKDLSGRGTVPLQMDILYKQQHLHPVIKWHQGAPHPRGYPYLNVGIYLDDAPKGDGCLRYVPGTQHSLVDIEGLSKEHGWEVPGVVELPAAAGDILIQDMMILHGSQPKRSPGVRRTIYVELRPFDGIGESGEQSGHWADLRKEWMQLVLEKAEEGTWPGEWLDDYGQSVRKKEEIIQSIVENREPPTPAVWGIHPVETEDYPVPADMKDWG
jgi:hypothetical protein